MRSYSARAKPLQDDESEKQNEPSCTAKTRRVQRAGPLPGIHLRPV